MLHVFQPVREYTSFLERAVAMTFDPATICGYCVFRAILVAICTAGMNADPTRRDGYNTLVVDGARQADQILEECGFVHPDLTAPVG